jgi:hypothetical protein
MRFVAGVAVSALIMGAGVVVLQRVAIARWAAESWLRQRGVDGLIEITRLDLGHFSGRLQLGDPNNPALKVERMDVDYDLLGPWNGQAFGVRTRQITLERPHLVARFRNGRMTFGPLQPIVDEALRRPAAGPAPSVRIHQGRVTTATDAGSVVFAGDALVAERRLQRLDGRITAVNLRSGETSLVSSGGPVWARTQHGVLTAGAQLDLTTYAAPGVTLSGGAVSLSGRTAYPTSDHGRYEGSGDFTITLNGGKVSGGALAGEAVSARAVLPGLQYAAGPEGFSVNGAGVVELNARRLAGGDVSGQAASAVLRLANLRAASGKTGSTLRADTSGAFNAARLSLGGTPLAGVAFSAEGPLSIGPAGASLMLAGGGSARLAMSRAEAARVAAATPVLSGDPDYRAALARALTGAGATLRRARLEVGPQATHLTIAEPVLVSASSGARLRLIPTAGRPLLALAEGGARGAARVTLAGGGLPDIDTQVTNWSARAGRWTADLALTAALDYGPANGIKITGARVQAGDAGEQTRVALAGCTPLTIKSMEGGEKDTVDIAGRVCPAGEPLVVARRGGWVARADFRETSAVSQLLAMRAQGAAGDVTARGGGKGPLAAEVRLASATFIDTEGAVRFEPVRASGRAALAADVWTGRLDLAAPSGPALGEVAFRHDIASGEGAAEVNAPAVAFAREGFQPIMISPLARAAAEAEGTVTFQGQLRWTRSGLTSAGRLRTDDFAFATPAGDAHGLAADIAFTSLNPLTTAPNQVVRIARLDALTPITEITATFTLAGDRLEIASAAGAAANGRLTLEPTTATLGEDGRMAGAVVLSGVDLGEVIATSTLADSVKLDAVVDGRLPFQAGEGVLRFEGGHLAAIKPGRISISRKALSGMQTSTPTDPGQANAVQDFAYQAMENLAFQSLSAEVASRPEGRLGVIFQIAGRHDPPQKQEALIPISALLKGDAFNQRIPLPSGTPINLTLDTSLNFDELAKALRDIWAMKKASQRRSAPVHGR